MWLVAINSLKHTHLSKFLSYATSPLLTVFHTLAGGESQLVSFTNEQDYRLGGSYAIETACKRSTFTACKCLAILYIHGKYHHALVFTFISGILHGFNTLCLNRAGKCFLVYVTNIIGGLNLVNNVRQRLRQLVAI